MTKRLSAELVELLRGAGWYEGRDVAHTLTLPSQFTLFPRAQEVLAEFGGLHFGSRGPGIQCVRSDLKIDPHAATHLASKLQGYERMLQTKLFPLGEVGGGDGYLIIDEEGRTYISSVISGGLHPLAPAFSECLELLLLGKKLNRQEIEETWPGTEGPGSRTLYAIVYNKWGTPAFKQKVEKEEERGPESSSSEKQ